MTGLENILRQIAADAQEAADEQLKSAQEKADQILAKAQEDGAQQAQAVLSNAEADAEEIRNRAHSAAQLNRRNLLLRFKQQTIRDVIDETRTALEQAPDEAYFSTLLKLVARFSQPGEAVMKLNRKDLERLPADFERALASTAPEAKVTVSREPAEIENGFLLIYGGIDVNCTFRAIFEDASDLLQDTVGAVIFPET